LKIKRLSDVCKSLKIKELMRGFVLLSYVFRKMARNCKATAKPLQNSKPLKIKHLIEFFAVKLELLKIKHLRVSENP
jgi:hypothetical protein